MLEVIDLGPPFQIQKTIPIQQDEFILSPDSLPRHYMDDTIRVKGVPTPRCTLKEGAEVAKGRNGTILLATRAPGAGAAICIKKPNDAAYSLTAEALIQWISSNVLREAGIHGAVPAVHDIYQWAGETRFTMDYIEGMSAVDAMLRSKRPDTLWLQILAQAALILGYLEERIHLDHRDLKADNLWIRWTPVHYQLTVGGIKWDIRAPFQVVLLDFGFSCLGNDEGNAVVSLSDGIVPKIDPCPKEGRDLFQFVASMMSIPQVRDRMGAEVTADMDLLLQNRGARFLDLVKHTTKSQWIYIAVSEFDFTHPPLHPVSLLQKLSHEWFPTAGVTVKID